MRPKIRKRTVGHTKLDTLLTSPGARERLAANAGVHDSHLARVQDGMAPSLRLAIYLAERDDIQFSDWLTEHGGATRG